MKKLLLLIFISIFSFSLFGKCGSSGIWVFPNGDEISKKSIIMIEGYATSQELIKNLKEGNQVYLKSKNHTVKLKVEGVYEGNFNLTQAILVPEEDLIVGDEYSLQMDTKKLIIPIHKVGKYGKPVSWKVKSEIDNEKPNWSSGIRPKLINTSYTRYGCGPAIYAHFNVKINDQSETLVKTEVMNLETKNSTTYYLISKDGKLDVGHGMCSGAFAFRKNGGYKVRFDLMDISGNSFGRWSEWTKIDNFQSKMGRINFLQNSNLSLPIGVILFFLAVFIKRHSNKV